MGFFIPTRDVRAPKQGCMRIHLGCKPIHYRNFSAGDSVRGGDKPQKKNYVQNEEPVLQLFLSISPTTFRSKSPVSW